MNELKVFENNEFGQIRTIEQNGEPWFVAADVCKALEIVNNRDALTRLDADEKGVASIDTPGGEQKMTTVNEPGLYALILGSRKPEAKAFKRWITHEVIPAIRQHGMYATPATVEEMLANPDTMIKTLEALKAERAARIDAETKNARLTVDNQRMLPKAEYFDELVDRNLLTNFRETAKELKIKERVFVGFLLDKKYVYRDRKGKLMPYENKNNGLFEIKECTNDKTAWSGTQTLITPKGRETFRLLMQGLSSAGAC